MHCRWVIKYFSCLLDNAVPNDGMIVTSVQHAVITAAIRQWHRRCQLVCRLAVDILNMIFSHAITHCPYADLLTNLTLKCAN